MANAKDIHCLAIRKGYELLEHEARWSLFKAVKVVFRRIQLPVRIRAEGTETEDKLISSLKLSLLVQRTHEMARITEFEGAKYHRAYFNQWHQCGAHA